MFSTLLGLRLQSRLDCSNSYRIMILGKVHYLVNYLLKSGWKIIVLLEQVI